MKLKKYEKNPILAPNPGNDWESLVVCNPGAWSENNKFYLLYRAAGSDPDHIIRFGLAVSENGRDFSRVSDKPVFEPCKNGPDAGCVEDPRIVKYDSDFYVTYAYRPYPPGQYWKMKHDEVNTPVVGKEAPAVLKKNITNTGLLMTKDFLSWKRLGRITRPDLDDRDVILFPEKINGKFALLHRPKQWVRGKYGVKYPSIWITFSHDMMVWEEPSYVLLTGREGTWEEKVGGGAPPLKTEAGWLVLYHGVEKGGSGFYRVGAMLLDLNDPRKIVAKSDDWIMEPDQYYEMEGPYHGCVFPTGNVILDGTLYVYYGGADKYIGLATCRLSDMIDYLLNSCRVKRVLI